MSFCKKVIFENFVTYEGLHGQRRYVTVTVRWYVSFIIHMSNREFPPLCIA